MYDDPVKLNGTPASPSEANVSRPTTLEHAVSTVHPNLNEVMTKINGPDMLSIPEPPSLESHGSKTPTPSAFPSLEPLRERLKACHSTQ